MSEEEKYPLRKAMRAHREYRTAKRLMAHLLSAVRVRVIDVPDEAEGYPERISQATAELVVAEYLGIDPHALLEEKRQMAVDLVAKLEREGKLEPRSKP